MLDHLAMLKTLVKHNVDFIVVGGLSAAFHGVPLNTLDLDIVHSRHPDNLTRLMAALEELDACYRLRTDVRLTPQLSHLKSPGHQLLRTAHGSLDVLGAIGDGLTYEDLVQHSTIFDVGQGLQVRTLNLEKYLELKELLLFEKDRAAIPLLRAALKEREKLRGKKLGQNTGL